MGPSHGDASRWNVQAIEDGATLVDAAQLANRLREAGSGPTRGRARIMRG